MPAALPQSVPASLGMGNLGFEDCESVCQLQLMRLVHQSTAAAGWLAYHPSPKQRQVVQAIPSSEGMAGLPDGRTLTAEPFVDQLFQQATEVQRDMWVLGHRPLSPWGGLVSGLRFRNPVQTEWADRRLWADLVLWQPPPLSALPGGWPDAPGNGRHDLATLGDLDTQIDHGAIRRLWASLPTEVAALQTAMRLDLAQQQQQQQVHHYQAILRRLEHQLRHPLAMIHLYAANLQNGLTQAKDRQQAQTIREAVGHLSDHLTEVIAGCQRSQVQTEVCSVPDLWAEAWRGLQPSAQAKQVALVLADQPLTLVGDRAQLLQAFTNLLHNALCFSPPQGQICAQWQVFHREAVITLTDQGPGLSPTDLQHLFRPYYSNRPQGSGIGLTIARHIVQQHGGKLWAENLPQGGAQFSMVLPLASP